MRITNRARNIKTGQPITTGTLTVVGPDSQPVATSIPINGTTGLWSVQTNGQPGVTTTTFTSSGQTKVVQGDTSGQSVAFCEGELPDMLRWIGDGVYPGIDNEMAVTVSGMNLTVGTGAAMVQGVFCPIYANETKSMYGTTLTVANGGASARTDLLVARLDRTSGGSSPVRYAGRVGLAIKQGTTTLTQDADTWEIEVARISVAAGASSLSAGNISTANRTWSSFRGGVAAANVTGLTEAAQDAVGAALTDSASVDLAYDDAANTITASLLYAGSGGNYGTGAKPARSDHTHTLAASVWPQTTSATVNNNGNVTTITAYCAAGDVVVGGGCDPQGGVGNMTVRASYGTPAAAGPASWTCKMTNNGNSDIPVTATAFCLRLTVS